MTKASGGGRHAAPRPLGRTDYERAVNLLADLAIEALGMQPRRTCGGSTVGARRKGCQHDGAVDENCTPCFGEIRTEIYAVRTAVLP